MFIAKGKQRQATRSQTKLITGSQALADPFLDKYKWSSLTCSSEYRVFLVINPLHAQTSMVCSQRAKVCVYLTKDVLLGQRLIIWSSSPSSCKQHVPQMSQYRSVKVPAVAMEQHHMWQSTWNVIRFQCPLVEQKFMNKLLVVSISPFATSSVELPHFLQRNSKMILIYLNVCETRWAKKLQWDEWFTPCLLNSPGEFKLASFLPDKRNAPIFHWELMWDDIES